MRDLTIRALAMLAAAACTRTELPLAVETPQIPIVICGNMISPPSVKIVVGDTVRFTADVCRPSGPVRWTINQPAIAQIDSASGLLRALAVGSATVTAASVQDPNNKGAVRSRLSRGRSEV